MKVITKKIVTLEPTALELSLEELLYKARELEFDLEDYAGKENYYYFDMDDAQDVVKVEVTINRKKYLLSPEKVKVILSSDNKDSWQE